MTLSLSPLEASFLFACVAFAGCGSDGTHAFADVVPVDDAADLDSASDIDLDPAASDGSGADAPDADGTDTDETGADTRPDVRDDVPGCTDDIYGPTSAERAIPVASGDSLSDLVLCEGVPDWFSVEAGEGTVATVRVDASAPVLLALDAQADATERVVGPGTSLELGVRSSGTVLARVEPSSGGATYAIRFAAGELPPCLATPEEPNDSAASAFTVVPPWSLETAICAGDEDWYAIDVPVGGTVEVELAFRHALGDIDVEGFDAAAPGALVLQSNSATDGERIEFGPAARATRLLVRVYGWDGATNAYTMTARMSVDETGSPAAVRGTVQYEDRVFDHSGFTGELRLAPVRGGAVAVVRRSDGVVVARGSTDDSGAFAIDYLGHAGQTYLVRASSVATWDGFRVEVRDRSGASALYSQDTEPFGADSDPARVALVARAAQPIGGAMNVADVTVDGFRFVARFSALRSPTLTYFWQDGLSYSCGSCYSRNAIRLGGQVEDPDQYDDDIILHEFAHYVVDHFSDDDSSGGTHRDRLVDPRLAYGEALGYFLSSAIRDDATMVDNFLGSVRFIDYEAVTIGGASLDSFFGTSDGTPGGAQREEVGAAILWDIFDGPNPDEPWDTVSLGGDVIRVLFSEYFTGASLPVDVGARGKDITDFVNAVYCARGGAEALQAILDDRAFPWRVAEQARCEFDDGLLP